MRRQTLAALLLFSTSSPAVAMAPATAPLATAQDAPAATGDIAPSERVSTAVLVREGPSTDTAILARLRPGDRARLIGEVPGWYRVALPGGTTGYVSKAWTIPLGPGAAAEPLVPDRRYKVHVIDVGTGLAVLVEGKDFALLYDAGSQDDLHDGDENRVVAYIRAARPDLRRLDHVILSHPHKDHLQLMPAVFDNFQVANVWESGRVNKTDGYCHFLKAAMAEPGSGGYSDQPFNWKFADFSGYAIKNEKPPVPGNRSLAQCIAADNDNSLFAYVCEKMFVDAAGNPTGWLASDDGSMELADFIHIDPAKKVISLVHVKASKSDAADRAAAPAEFEVVVSQAVKNLRHLDRRNLFDELKRGKAKKIGAAVWHDGIKQADREGFLAAAKKLPRATARQLIVLQPRLTLKERTRCTADDAPPSHSLRLKQIETLMLAARASALACGATFIGYADKV